jgi:L-galactose dehydrogenase
MGRTGLKVSALGLGGSEIGGHFRPVDESVAIRAVHAALDLGINFIDTSPFYGLTRAETVLGKALHGIPRDRYYVGTKVGRYGDEEFDFSAARTKASVDESLERLGLDYVDLIQVHDSEFRSYDQVIKETLPALRDVCKAGKARFIGVTGFPLKMFRTIAARAEIDVFLTYCHYTLWNDAAAALVTELQGKNLGVINAAVLGMGLLSKHGTLAWHPASQELKSTCAKAVAHCAARGADISALAIQFALANKKFHTTLAGTADPEEVRRNVRAAETPLDAGLLAEVQAILAPVRNQTWPSGRPENN